ncbi:hypothetical protein E4U42_005855 [Claviceps africana]|uniref:Phosphoglycerate mutase family protein n=1 Tax=Claviceps africana TaxID=83212 RepID=A0A8K0J5Z9_9HYPO|nr:hypothetical protein E4U42_005855 [Claviceps africana]
MHLLLVRHAESVDNVAGLYGGSRDAALTAHGVMQTRRLASALVDARLDIRHVLSSPLQRAAKTASAICDAFNGTGRAANGHVLTTTLVPELREKHFGSWEGVKYAPAASATSRPPQTDAETPEAMRTRAISFLDQHLWPAVCQTMQLDSDMACVVVVSHGILLGILTQTLASKLARGSSSSAIVANFASQRISWSNTGYLDIDMARHPATLSALPEAVSPWASLHSRVSQINCTKHLARLHKTRGGIGSAAHDDRQRTLEGFFAASSRKRKADDDSTK